MSPEVIVAGHICLDVIPTIETNTKGDENLFFPGKLIRTGKVSISTGGVVSNTGIALHRLGIPVRLVGKIGNDLFGSMIINVLKNEDPLLTEGIVVTPDADSSYSIVLSAPEVDRIFLHHSGTNDLFSAVDIPYDDLQEARWFHFGYPPLMRRQFINDGLELRNMFLKVKEKGLATSLDMAMPDEGGESGKVDWIKLLKNVLPHVDLFIPSFEEILFMMRDDPFLVSEQPDSYLTPKFVQYLAQRLLNMGCKIVCLKLGDQGLYLRTSGMEKMKEMGNGQLHDLRSWTNRELWAPCFKTTVIGTTGAGDCAIAGFLAGILKGGSPEDVVISASAVGACNVEESSATAGIIHWDKVQERVSGWEQLTPQVDFSGWRQSISNGIWKGPSDSSLQNQRES